MKHQRSSKNRTRGVSEFCGHGLELKLAGALRPRRCWLRELANIWTPSLQSNSRKRPRCGSLIDGSWDQRHGHWTQLYPPRHMNGSSDGAPTPSDTPGPRSRDPGVVPGANLQPVSSHEKRRHRGSVLVALVSVALTAGPWQEVDRRVKYGWRLALLPAPRVWTKTERLFIAQRPGGVTECVALAHMQANTAPTCASWNPPHVSVTARTPS